jgi:probable phosphoglycerate mutase
MESPQKNYLTERLISGETPTLIYLVRHGETVLTPERRFSGDGELDPALTEKGIAQAKAVAAVIPDRQPTRLISSPLQRTRQTAAEIAATTGLTPEFNESWREASFGYWDGLSVAEVKEQYPDEWARWVREIDFAPGGGESYSQVGRRANFAISKLAAQYPGESIVVVTHNAFIKSALAAVMEVSPEAVFHLDVGTCSISTIAIYPSDGLRAVRSVNERSHISH